jgi:hypothetical protein
MSDPRLRTHAARTADPMIVATASRDERLSEERKGRGPKLGAQHLYDAVFAEFIGIILPE